MASYWPTWPAASGTGGQRVSTTYAPTYSPYWPLGFPVMPFWPTWPLAGWFAWPWWAWLYWYWLRMAYFTYPWLSPMGFWPYWPYWW